MVFELKGFGEMSKMQFPAFCDYYGDFETLGKTGFVTIKTSLNRAEFYGLLAVATSSSLLGGLRRRRFVNNEKIKYRH